ncbi:MAG: hypothetical protein FWE37_00145 [Spirochaetaceae bacterium]|nr:hypothetical protein [Spirochaetaceae bacterium]
MKLDIKKEAIRLFNETWDLFDKAERNADDNAEMLNKAHASRYLWGFVGHPANFARGDWLISRAYAMLKESELALLYGQKSLEIALSNNLEALDVAFGHEACARAYALLGDNINMLLHKQKGLEATTKLEQEDKEYAEGIINGI